MKRVQGLQMLSYDIDDGITCIRIGEGPSDPFQFAFFCKRREAYIVLDRYKNYRLYEVGKGGEFQQVNKFWFSKSTYEMSFPGWSNYMMCVLAEIKEDGKIVGSRELPMRFADLEEVEDHLLNYYEAYSQFHDKETYLLIYRPGRRKEKDKYYLKEALLVDFENYADN